MTELHALGHVRLETEALQFYGPKTNHCFGTPYVTFALGGVKEEGEILECVEGMKEAHKRFMEELNEYTKDAKQIAWRMMPEFTSIGNDMYTIRCRLAMWV